MGVTRRAFIKVLGAAVAGAAVAPTEALVPVVVPKSLPAGGYIVQKLSISYGGDLTQFEVELLGVLDNVDRTIELIVSLEDCPLLWQKIWKDDENYQLTVEDVEEAKDMGAVVSDTGEAYRA